MTLEEAFGLGEREVISLVGGGGKTTLMFALGRELSSRKKGILLTTTTKIWNPKPSEEFALFLSKNLSELKAWVGENLNRYPYLILAQEKLDNGKLQGVPPSWIAQLGSISGVRHIIVEADGAAGRSLKAPREGEPVLPPDTTLLIPVVGIDVLGKPLNERYVFRSKIATQVFKVPEGAIVNEKMIGRLLGETLKNMPDRARVIPFINKMDLPGGLDKGRILARVLVASVFPKIESAILGQAMKLPTVKEVVVH